MSTAVVERWPLVGRWDELDALERALADASTGGVVLSGAAGVGKTRLADELRQHLERAGRITYRAAASKAFATAPLGAMAHLLPPDVGGGAADDVAVLFQRSSETFAAIGASVVLMVDDIHLLDTTSLVLITQLVANGFVALIGTVRTDEPMPDGLDALLRSDRVTRVELETLARNDVATLLHLALGGPVEGATTAALWEASQGNALFLRELVLGSRATGALRDIGGVWSLDGPLQGSGRLREFIEQRLASVDASVKPLLETLACCQRIALRHALERVSLEALDALERDGLVTIENDDRRQYVTFGHPLYGELLRSTLGVLAVQRAFKEEADRIERAGARRREDPLLIASWRLEANVVVDDVELLLRAARLARNAHDFPQVARLARAASRVEPCADAAQLLGEACYEYGEFEEAEAVLAPFDDGRALDIAVVRSTNLFWGLQRADDAIAVRQRARAATTDTAARDLLRAGEAAVLTFSGRPLDALALLDEPATSTDTRATVARIIAEAPARAFTGETARALQLARDGFELHSALGDAVAMAHPGSHVVAQILALTESGGIAEARELANAMYEIAIGTGIPILRMWATMILGRVTLLAGRPATARRWFTESAALANSTGFVAIRRLASSGAAMCAGIVGDTEGARAAADDAAPTANERTFMAPELWLGSAWAAVAASDPARARELLLNAAADAEASGHRTSAGWMLYDVARLGAPEVAAPRLAELATQCDGDLARARAQHADALARHNPGALAEVVEQFTKLGANLYAAEAAIAASDAFRRAGEQRDATAAQERASALIALCEDARTPGLVSAATVTPLTRREREIAMLAAEGFASKEIAERLFLSARTVDNHLQRVYTKLGVTKRSELATALARREEDV